MKKVNVATPLSRENTSAGNSFLVCFYTSSVIQSPIRVFDHNSLTVSPPVLTQGYPQKPPSLARLFHGLSPHSFKPAPWKIPACQLLKTSRFAVTPFTLIRANPPKSVATFVYSCRLGF